MLKFRVVSNIGPKLAVSYVEQVTNLCTNMRSAPTVLLVRTGARCMRSCLPVT